MNRVVPWCVLVLSLLATATWSQAQKKASTEETVADLEQQWLKSQRINNTDLLVPLLADGFTATSSAGKVTDKAGTIADAKATKYTSVDYLDVKVVVFGETAIATGNFRAKGTDPSGEGVFTIFDPPGATSSSVSTVNPSGAVVGNYTDTVGELFHGCLLKNGTYTTIDFPGALYGTFAGGGNPENDIVGEYNFTSSCTTDCNHAFLLHNGVFTSFDYPGAIATTATGINPGGVIVGVFQDSSGNVHGFIRTP